MLIDKTHVRWSLISAGILLAAGGSYAVYAARAIPGPSGGSLMGLLYGVAGSLLMIFAGLLAVRRRLPTLRVGSAQFWLRGHLWLGTVSFVLILFHSGFQFGSTLETALMISFIVVVVSGFYGLALQQVIPRLLTIRVPLETFNQQVPFVCRRLQAESDVLIAELCGKLDCEHESVSDAAYNLADALGKLRNGKEGEDFQKFLDGIYTDGSGGLKRMRIEAAGTETPESLRVASVERSKPAPPGSTANAPETPAAADKPMSKIEMARAAAAKKKAEKSAGEAPETPAAADKPMSKIEMARAAAAKKKGAQASPLVPALSAPGRQIVAVAQAPQPPPKPVVAVYCPNCDMELVLPDRSFLGRFARCPQCTQKFVLQLPVEEEPEPAPPAPQASPPPRIEQRVAAVEDNGAGDAEEKPARPLSKLELARAAAKKPAAANGPEKPRSKLALARAAAGKPAAGEPAGEKPQEQPPATAAPAKPKRKPAAKGSADPEAIPRTDILKQFYLASVRPYLADERRPRAAGSGRVSAQTFGQMRNDLPAQLHPVLDRLQEVCDERRQFALQQRLHWLLHSWLIVHVPATVALFVLFLVHVVVALRVIPWPH